MLTPPECKDYEVFVERYQSYVYPVIAHDILSRVGEITGPIIDAGTGPGYLALEFVRRTPQCVVHALDYSPHMLALARQRIEAAGCLDRVSFDLVDIHDTQYASGMACLIVSYSCLHHWANPPRALRELHRVLAPGGHAFIIDTCKEAAGALLTAARPVMPEPAMFRFVKEALDESYSVPDVEAIIRDSGLKSVRLTLYQPSEDALVENLDVIDELPFPQEAGASPSSFLVAISKDA